MCSLSLSLSPSRFRVCLLYKLKPIASTFCLFSGSNTSVYTVCGRVCVCVRAACGRQTVYSCCIVTSLSLNYQALNANLQ